MSNYTPKQIKPSTGNDSDLANPVSEELDMIDTDNLADSSSTSSPRSAPAKFRRKGKPFRALIMLLTLVFILLCLTAALQGQAAAAVDMGIYYTDNAFQSSDFDLQRFEDGNPFLDFVKASDDVVLKTGLYGAYQLQYQWWKILPLIQIDARQNFLNPSRQRLDTMVGVRVSRQLGELGLFYAYTPETYVRSYIDTGGSEDLEDFSYTRNLYRASLTLNPFKKSKVNLDYRLEQYFYNQYFTEFDGNLNVMTLGWQQNFPLLYLDAAYAFKDFNTTRGEIATNPEDASYESNVWSLGALIKKMPLDARYPGIQWRPGLDLRFETRYYQGSDHWHAGRTDDLNTTTGTLHFYFGDRWNLNLDYSHLFRNVDALASDVMKLKEFSENRFGFNVRYQL